MLLPLHLQDYTSKQQHSASLSLSLSEGLTEYNNVPYGVTKNTFNLLLEIMYVTIRHFIFKMCSIL